VVAATVTRSRRRAAIVVALLAVGFIAAMALSGARPEGQWFVKFEATGLMRETPERIDRIELTATGRRLHFVRVGSGAWTAEGGPSQVSAPLASHLEMSLRFMHVAAPVRVMRRDEWEGVRLEEFGLDPPRYAIALHQGDRVVLATAFGSTNPQRVAQYVRVEGRPDLYLMPRFVGREWELVADATSRR